MRRRVSKAFTLVEILIVVVILGILAAIVVPQFTSASQEAQASNVATQLQTIRNQIELYRVRNNGAYPDLSAGWGDITGPDYLRTDPVNPRTNSSAIAAADDPAVGWIWIDTDADGNEDTLNAAYFDEAEYAAGNDPWTGP
jgi:general secretion pathway protein G